MKIKTVSIEESRAFEKGLGDLLNMLTRKKMGMYKEVIYTLIRDNQTMFNKLQEIENDTRNKSTSGTETVSQPSK